MYMRQSTLAVALVIALSAAAATTQVFAPDDLGTSPVAFGNDLLQTFSNAGPASDPVRTVALVEKAR